MSLKSTENQYATMIVLIHWLTVILVVALLALGFRAAGTADPLAKAAILRVHVPIAVCVFLLTALRIVWWWFIDRRPKPVAGSPRWQELTAQLVHYSLYVVILAMVGSGFGLMALSGAGPIIFGGVGTLPDFAKYPPRLVHGIAAVFLVGLIALHFGAALYHQFILRDGLLRRMWFSR